MKTKLLRTIKQLFCKHNWETLHYYYTSQWGYNSTKTDEICRKCELERSVKVENHLYS